MLLTGATGLIGSALVARLQSQSHQVVAVVRRMEPAARRLMAAQVVELDIARATTPETWLPHLTGIDAVVNCAGVFQDSPRDCTAGVHVNGASALFAACERSGVRRVVQLSALGVAEHGPSQFSRSKFRGDQNLMARDLDWIILRPSVVVGRAAYGGSALFRGLAVLPLLPVPADTGPLQIVQLDELVEAIVSCLSEPAPAKMVLEIAGPKRYTLSEVVQAYRRWLGWPSARVLPLPKAVSSLLYGLGDIAGWLGWRSPLRRTARQELVRGAVSDQQQWIGLLGIAPRSLETALLEEPAAVQERWFAQLYLLKPLTIGMLSLFWILTGLIALGLAQPATENLLGFAKPIAAVMVIGGGLLDLLIGIFMAIRATAKIALLAALGISAFYLVAGTILTPELWADPLGPMLKILPIMVLNLVAIAILDER